MSVAAASGKAGGVSGGGSATDLGYFTLTDTAGAFSLTFTAIPEPSTYAAILGALTVTRQLKPLIVTSHLLFGFTTLSLLWWLVMTLWMRKDPPPSVAAS